MQTKNKECWDIIQANNKNNQQHGMFIFHDNKLKIKDYLSMNAINQLEKQENRDDNN